MTFAADYGHRRFALDRTKGSIDMPDVDYGGFEPGVDVLYWNGVPIRRAIELNGESQAGSNSEARFARGLDNLTIRPLDTTLPPDEVWVDLTYRSKNGEILTLKHEWLVRKTGVVEAAPLEPRASRKKRRKWRARFAAI